MTGCARPAVIAALITSVLCVLPPARAATVVPPPSMPAADAWVGRAQAQVRVLDKLDASISVVTLAPGEVAHVKSLSIRLGRCLSRPDGLPQDAAAWLEIDDQRPDTPTFANWLFVAEPSLVMFQNPVYGVTLVGCSGAQTAAYPGHEAQPAPPPTAPDGSALPQSPGGSGPPTGDAVPGIPDPNATPSPDAPATTPSPDAPAAPSPPAPQN